MINTDFMRQQQINIINYLPDYLSKDDNFNDTCTSLSMEQEKIRLLLQDCLNQLYVKSATWGLDRWEKVLDIKATSKDYSKRRRDILLKLQGTQTSTLNYMTMLCRRYFVDTCNLKIEQDYKNYAFKIIADACSYDYNGLCKAIETYKPAHLAYIIVRLLTAAQAEYTGIVMQTGNLITINTNNDIEFNISDKNIYFAGTIQQYNITEV